MELLSAAELQALESLIQTWGAENVGVVVRADKETGKVILSVLRYVDVEEVFVGNSSEAITKFNLLTGILKERKRKAFHEKRK